MLRFCLLQPIPFLQEASPGQVTLLWICIAVTFLEKACSAMIANPQPPTDEYEDEKLSSAISGVVSRGFHAGCRELRNIWVALATIFTLALQLAWKGIGIAALAAYRTGLAGRNALLAAGGVLGAGMIGHGMRARDAPGSADSFSADVIAEEVPPEHPVEPDVPPDHTDATKEDADALPDSSPDAMSTIFASFSALSATFQSMFGASDGDPDDGSPRSPKTGPDDVSPRSPEEEPTTYGTALDPSDEDYISI